MVWRFRGDRMKTVFYRTTTNEQFEKLKNKLNKEFIWTTEWSRPADTEQITMRHKFIILDKIEYCLTKEEVDEVSKWDIN